MTTTSRSFSFLTPALLAALAAGCGGSQPQARTAPAPNVAASPAAPTGESGVRFGRFVVEVPEGYEGKHEDKSAEVAYLVRGDKAVIVLISTQKKVPKDDAGCTGFAQGVAEGFMSAMLEQEVKVDVSRVVPIPARTGLDGGGCQIQGNTSSAKSNELLIVSSALRSGDEASDAAVFCMYSTSDATAVAGCNAVIAGIQVAAR